MDTNNDIEESRKKYIRDVLFAAEQVIFQYIFFSSNYSSIISADSADIRNAYESAFNDYKTLLIDIIINTFKKSIKISQLTQKKIDKQIASSFSLIQSINADDSKMLSAIYDLENDNVIKLINDVNDIIETLVVNLPFIETSINYKNFKIHYDNFITASKSYTDEPQQGGTVINENIKQKDIVKIVKNTLDMQAKLCMVDSIATEYISTLRSMDPNAMKKIVDDATKAFDKATLAIKKRDAIGCAILCLSNAELVQTTVPNTCKDMTVPQLLSTLKKTCEKHPYDIIKTAQIVKALISKDASAYNEYKEALYDNMAKKDATCEKYEYLRRYVSYLTPMKGGMNNAQDVVP